MAALWEEADGGDSASVCVAPLVDEAFWQEAAFWRLVRGQADARYVVRWVEEGATLGVENKLKGYNTSLVSNLSDSITLRDF